MRTRKNIRRIGVLTSGGDSPGMNAAIRAVVRTAIYNNLEVVGIMRGYSGLLSKQFMSMQSHSVSKIISQGGTMLKSSRCPEFKNPEVRKVAYENLQEPIFFSRNLACRLLVSPELSTMIFTAPILPSDSIPLLILRFLRWTNSAILPIRTI